MSGTADPRVLLIAGFRQRRRRPLTKTLTAPFDSGGAFLGNLGELELKGGVFIAREDPEENPLRKLEGAAVERYAELDGGAAGQYRFP